MPPRRRNKANSARSAAIQAVRRRQGDAVFPSSSHYQQHICPVIQQQNYNNRDDSDDSSDDSDVPTLLGNKQEDLDNRPSQQQDDGSDDLEGCLHCHAPSTDIQVHCDECQAFICQACHWCHEFQANHEIRVCDHCDAFYCRNCDEMDQCDDCGEVVCASCSTLLSCKFCGCGLCEECATACGRCGIVLCSRDAKFAVECDTCRMSYCLVCLASGSKDPCVRCGHRPSKRMEQLVHLRLKSIYKAFKQSSSSSSNQNYHNYHNYHGKNTTTFEELEDDDDDIPDLDVDNSILLAAAAAKNHATNYMNSPKNYSSSHSQKVTQNVLAERYIQEKEKADAAAQALLAELEEEEEAAKSKKSKKKRKKKRQQAAKREEEEEEKKRQEEKTTKEVSKQKQTFNAKAKPEPSTTEENDEGIDNSVDDDEYDTPPPSNNPEESPPKEDDVETKLVHLVADCDIEGIEDILFALKGVPGRAALRKNAKKALKRLRCSAHIEDEVEDVAVASSTVADSTSYRTNNNNYNYKNDFVPHRGKEGMQPMHVPTTSTGELLKVVSDTNTSKSNRAECVMQMSPSVVGWVIGKGGQRIRDLMEESGAKVWIDQEKAKPQECRNVYISGERKSVDMAVKMVKDIVAKAPIGHQLQQQQEQQQREAAAKVEESKAATKEIPDTSSPNLDSSNVGAGATTVSAAAAPTVPKVEMLLNPEKKLETQTSQASVPPSTLTRPVAAPSSVMESSTEPFGYTANDHEVSADHVLTCEARFVPLLIGKRGWTIKNIQDESGARVDIDQTVTPRQIKISGLRADVKTAIDMVRDVLSYPHAQLQKQQQNSTGLAEGSNLMPTTSAVHRSKTTNNSEDRTYSPPPSLAIITGDAKSAISSSSSLSSTPEPSMASSSNKSYTLSTGPLIPPEYGSSSHMPPGPGNAFMPLPVDATSGFSPRGLNGGPPFLIGMQQQILGMGMPPHPQQQQHLAMYNQNAPVPSKDPSLPTGFAPTMHHHTPAPLDFGVTGQARSNASLPGVQPSFLNHSGAPASQQFNQYNNMAPPDNSMRGMLPVENVKGGASSTFNSGDASRGLWNPTSTEPEYQRNGMQPSQSAERGYYNRKPRSGSLPLFENGQPTAVQPNAPFTSIGNVGTGVDDSRMVDSLFASMGNAGASDAQQNLLTGFNNLSIESDTQGGGIEGAGGLWGQASLSDWNKQGNEAPETTKDPAGLALFSGLPATDTDLQERNQHHPTESRFNWNYTNAL